MATISRVNGGARPLGTDAGNLSVTGRTLTHYTVTLAGLYDYGNGTVKNYAATGSQFETLVLAIEQVGSIELLGAPQSGNLFHVALSGAAPTAPQLQAYVNTSANVGGAGIVGTAVTSFTY